MSIKQYPGGIITKNPTAPTTSSAKGIWTLDQAQNYTKQGIWPRSPGAPTIGTATDTAAGGTVSVTFTAPSCTGSNAISSYTAISTPSCITASGASSPISVTGLANGTSYTFRVRATNGAGTGPTSAASNSATPTLPVVGGQVYTTPGTYSWVAPSGVTSVSLVAVGAGGSSNGRIFQGCYNVPRAGGGGGGLGYKNNFSVTPGSSYTVYVGTPQLTCGSKIAGDSYFSTRCVVKGGAGSGAQDNNAGGTFTGCGGGNGGKSGTTVGAYPAGWVGIGGGGAGGYNGTSGISSYGGVGLGGVREYGYDGYNGAGGGGASGCGGGSNNGGGGGGSVGLYGQGSNGVGATLPGYGGGGGSGGAGGTNRCGGVGGAGASPGGGAGSTAPNNSSTATISGGNGAVRVIWPGSTRSFPSTCTGALGGEFGSFSFTTSGSYTWVAPAGVTKVSVVAIGGGSTKGGSLGYKNNISVTPGSSYTVVVGASNATSRFQTTVQGSGGNVSCAPFYVGDGGGLGSSSAGGGAGGYAGNGGSGTGGSGGNGGYFDCGCTGQYAYGGGGGVGLYGQGASGANGTRFCRPGKGGSCGANGSNINFSGYVGGNGGAYGGGGGSGNAGAGTGAFGAVRIVWPGCARSFPSTCVGTP